MIREARIEDIPRMVEIGREFFNFAGGGRVTEYDPKSIAKTFIGLIENEASTVLVMEIDGEIEGGIAAVLYPSFVNFSHITGQEFFWFVSEKYRGAKESIKLLNAVEGWAKDKGAKSFVMTALSCNFETLKKFYERKGYIQQETNFIRRL